MSTRPLGVAKLLRHLFVLLLICFHPFAHATTAEVVWTEFDGKQHLLLHSDFDGEQWRYPGEVVYRSENALLTPVIGVAADGHKALVWSEVRRGKIILMHQRGIARDGRLEWQSPQLLTDRGMENLGPAMVRDRSGTLWLFWASATVEPSDLYMSRLGSGGWTARERVNGDNEVPDNRPTARLDKAGNVLVEWHTYDLENRAYTLENKTFLLETAGSVPLPADTDGEEKEVPSPSFVPTATRVFIHYPSHVYQQYSELAQ